jgi:hypothetical protein
MPRHRGQKVNQDINPLVQPSSRATQGGTDGFRFLPVKKTLYGPGPLLLNVINHEHLHFGFGVHDCDRVAIRLSENVVHDVLAHYFVYDVMAFNK